VVGGKKGAVKVVRSNEMVEEVESGKMYVPKYTSTEQDVSWDCKGLVVTVLNGEAIPLLQCRIFDAGFEKLNIIPMGADKVLLRLEDEGDVAASLMMLQNFSIIFLRNQ
jgi:hypothetical protein